MAQKIKYPMKFEKNCIKMKGRSMRIYLDQTGRDFTRRCSWNLLLKVLSSNALCWVKISNGMKIFKFFTIYRIILKFLPTFYSFLPFELIWCCRNPFWVRFDRDFDPFMPTVGIMFKMAYRLGFTSVFILHNLMTISF